MSSDRDVALDIRNQETIARVHNGRLDPPAEGEPCAACNGTGVLPNTETENLFGESCHEGCKIDLQRIRDQGQG
jgi:hypothetical protein